MMRCPENLLLDWAGGHLQGIVLQPDGSIKTVGAPFGGLAPALGFPTDLIVEKTERYALACEVLANIIEAARPIAAPSEADTRPPDLTPEETALALLVKHPDWTDTQIAQTVPCNRRTLYKWERYRQAREALKSGRASTPTGSKDSETGSVEAWDDEAE